MSRNLSYLILFFLIISFSYICSRITNIIIKNKFQTDILQIEKNMKSDFYTPVYPQISDEPIFKSFGVQYKEIEKPVVIPEKKETLIVKPDIPFRIGNYTLLGTVTGSKGLTTAVLYSKKDRKDFSLKTGDKLEGAVLKRIERRKVIFLTSSGEQELLFKVKTSVNLPDNRKNFSYTPEIITDKIRRISMTEDELNREIFSNVESIMTTTNIVPVYTKNSMSGIKINKLNRNSILARRFGIKRGDILKRVNGHKLDSMEKALRIWENVRDEKHVEVDIQRGISNITLSLNVK